LRAQLGYVQGLWRRCSPANNRFYAGGEGEIRGFDVRGANTYGYVPNRINFQLTNPDGSCVPRDPNNPQFEPVHPGAAAGLRIALHRWRYQPHDQCRVPHSHRRPGYLRILRRLRHRCGSQQRAIEAESRGFCLAHPRRFMAARFFNNGSCRAASPARRLDSSETSAYCRAPTSFRHVHRLLRSSVIMPIINAPSASIMHTTRWRLYEQPFCNAVVLGSNNESCTRS